MIAATPGVSQNLGLEVGNSAWKHSAQWPFLTYRIFLS
jgi:hypothetical protein